MTKIPHYLLLSLIILFSFSSCEEDENALDRNKKILIDVGIWKIVSLRVGPSDVPLDACVSDNTYHFETGNNYIMDEGGSKCDPGDGQTLIGEWSLTSNGDGLVITLDGTTKITTIDELTNLKLKISYELGPVHYEEVYEPN